MKTMKKFTTLMALVVIFSMLLAAVPMGTAKAATGLDFLGGTWTETGTVNVTGGRPSVVYDGSVYHMWYTYSGVLYHTTSPDGVTFTAGTAVNGLGPIHDSPAITMESNGGEAIYYLISYGMNAIANTGENEFWIYTSKDGVDWTPVKKVLDLNVLPAGATAAPDGYQFAKIDGPSLMKDGSTWTMYFQAKTTDISISTTAWKHYYIYSVSMTGTLADLAKVPATATFSSSATLELSPDSPTVDGNFMMHPWVVKEGNTSYMWYSATATVQTLWYAMDTGSGFAKNGTSILGNTVTGVEPNVIKVGNTWHMWYGGATNTIHHMTLVYPQPVVTAEIDPALTTIRRNGTFTAKIYGSAHDLYGVDVNLAYDPLKLQPTALVLGTGLTPCSDSGTSYASGFVHFAYSQCAPTPAVTGDRIELATITFQVLGSAAAGDTSLSFTSALFSDNNGVALPDVNITGMDSISIVEDTMINGTVTLQGRTSNAGVTVTLTTTTPPAPIGGGNFAFGPLDAGTYTLTAEMPGYLDAVLTRAYDARAYTLVPLMLRGGDTDDDHVVNVNDLTAIATDYQATAQTAGKVTDINGDGAINILDLTMAGANYGGMSNTVYADWNDLP